MTIQERLRRSNFIMLVVPVAIAGVQRVQEGDLDTPIAYEEPDEFRPACDAVDEMAARLKESLAQQQKEQQKKQELIAELSHGLKTPLTPRLLQTVWGVGYRLHAVYSNSTF